MKNLTYVDPLSIQTNFFQTMVISILSRFILNLMAVTAVRQQHEMSATDVIVSANTKNFVLMDDHITAHYKYNERVIDRRNFLTFSDVEDVDENDQKDSIIPNTTFVEIPRKSKEGSNFQISTMAIILALIPMIALLGAFTVVQCKTRSPNALNAYVIKSKLKTESLDEDGSISIDDKESELSSNNHIFQHTIFEPQWQPQDALYTDLVAYSDAYTTKLSAYNHRINL